MVSKPDIRGVDANQRLSSGVIWVGSLTIGQDFKPDLRNSAVRNYRGAAGNVAKGTRRLECRSDYLLLEPIGTLGSLPLAARRGRRTALTFPDGPPPQKN